MFEPILVLCSFVQGQPAYSEGVLNKINGDTFYTPEVSDHGWKKDAPAYYKMKDFKVLEGKDHLRGDLVGPETPTNV